MSLRLAPVVALLTAACGCSQNVLGAACTEIGCHDGLSLRFQPDHSWPSGAYRVRVVVDDVTVTCEGTLPLRACDAGKTFTCDHSLVRVGESGCALPAAQHGLSELFIDTSQAQSVSLTIERDGQPLATTTLRPQYATSRPNGPECPPVCTSATVNVPLQFPSAPPPGTSETLDAPSEL